MTFSFLRVIEWPLYLCKWAYAVQQKYESNFKTSNHKTFEIRGELWYVQLCTYHMCNYLCTGMWQSLKIWGGVLHAWCTYVIFEIPTHIGKSTDELPRTYVRVQNWQSRLRELNLEDSTGEKLESPYVVFGWWCPKIMRVFLPSKLRKFK